MIKRILRYGEDALRKESQPIKEITDAIRELVKDMFETMYKNNGVGLAGPQVGENINLFIIDTGNGQKLVFINPQIIKASGKEVMDEGCLSFPGMHEKVERALRVTAHSIGLDGEPYEIKAEGLLARAIQHELDHLSGILLVDRISKARRFQMKHELARIAAGESLDEDIVEDNVEDDVKENDKINDKINDKGDDIAEAQKGETGVKG